jgi:squalene-hopene cyclase-like protein
MHKAIFMISTAIAAVLMPSQKMFSQDVESQRVRQIVESSLRLLQTSGRTFTEKSREHCVSCHHQAVPALTFSLARTRGFQIDEAIAQEQFKVTFDQWTSVRERLLQIDTGPPPLVSEVISAGYALFSMAAEGQKPNSTTDALAHYIAARQYADGQFRSLQVRPPLDYSSVSATALAIRAMQLYMPPGRKDEAREKIARARAWLLSLKSDATEEKDFQLQGLAWAQAERKDIARFATALLANQRLDGGWAQLPGLESDAYATGQALVALHQAAGLPTTSPAYRHGVQFLLRTHLPDGSWHVKTRAGLVPVQPYFETGFPHGRDQFISAAGTAWAASALILSLQPNSGSVFLRQ